MSRMRNENIPGHPSPSGDNFVVSLSQQHPYWLLLQEGVGISVRSMVN